MSVEEFFASQPFAPDAFQREAVESVASGRSVVVTAPTGAGKTLIAEAAVHLAVEGGRRAFYTTPIKALSNQKFADLKDVYGPAGVGLLTGDNVINGDAAVVVMTTEVVRNMIYADPARLDGVEVVVLDEVHYLQDPFRGAVWEEVIIHAPGHVRMVALSATIANAAEFSEWVEARRGPTDLIVATERPVPLIDHYMIKDVRSQEVDLLPTFAIREGRRRTNPRIERFLASGRSSRFTGPRRVEVINELAGREMLPVIYFIFSRAACDAAALGAMEAGLQLTTREQRALIRDVAEARTDHIDPADLAVLGYERWILTLEAGVAAHHAGLVPAFKETVEELFVSGLLSVVFATETLALGINMPARSVVLESLSKFDGETHRLLQPGDYTQLTGRAGRRGIDEVGHGVVLHSRWVPFRNVAKLAEAGSHPLLSSFRPTYNMAANLIANYAESRAKKLLEASFAQFQRSGAAGDAHRRLAQLEERLAEEERKATCERGSVAELAELLGRAETPGGPDLMDELRPGDVVDVPGGSRAGRYVVLNLLSRQKGARLLVMGTSGRVSTVGRRDLGSDSRKAGRLELPVPMRPKDRRFRQDTLRRLRSLPPARRGRPRQAGGPPHPVAACPDVEAHLHWLRRSRRTHRRIEEQRQGLRNQGFGLVDEFEAIRSLLEDWGYLEGWELHETGERLRFIYNELDLLVAEACERKLFHGLDAVELAALASTFVYEPRREESTVPAWPTAELAHRWEKVEELWEALAAEEQFRNLPVTRAPDPGAALAVYQWADGVEFEGLSGPATAPGDFVRMARQLVDLVRQIRDTYPDLAETSRTTLTSVDRGIVTARGAG